MSDRFISTYRIQLRKNFTLEDAANILPYLKSLGISHLYLSPIFESTKDSVHGYDICDFTKISAERGGEEAFAKLDALCSSYNIRILLDIVPNHMGIAGENPFWLDVLAKGRESRYWSLFDLRVGDDNQIHLPVLDKPIEECLENGDAVISDHDVYGRILKLGNRILPLGSKDINDQSYKPVLWTEAFDKISYRRFFDITDLVGVRVEDPDIYNISHNYLFDLCKKYPSICGVRVDHIDGLADPTSYLGNLKNNIENIWIEKILSRDEEIPENWAIQGTTGYEFIAHLNQLLVDPQGFKVLQQYWTEHIDDQWNDFKSCVRQGKEDVLKTLFPSELKRLIKLSSDIGSAEQAEVFWRGMTLAFDAYRTYAGKETFSKIDKERTEKAALKAKNILGTPFETASAIFLPILLDPKTDIEKQLIKEWQQLSGPVMAKGLEDCAHYRYNPLTALNEVGCEAEIDEEGIENYFSWSQSLAQNFPHSLLATSTHDTKRSEDVRARLYTLADKPKEWIDFYERAVTLNASLKKEANIRPATEYFLYQAIIGIWPLDGNIGDEFIDRICDYMQKSAKEARMETSWLNPNKTYEETLKNFIQAIFKNDDFIAHTQKFVSTIEVAGVLNSITALTLKILGPGVPDFYQGTDKWNFSLVDPDNRRPVTYDAAKEFSPKLNVSDLKSDDFKKWYTHKLLSIRKKFGKDTIRLERLFCESDEIIAYQWENLIVLCPRYNGRASPQMPSLSFDADFEFEQGTYKNLINDQVLNLDGKSSSKPIFSESPIAVLMRQT